MPKGALEGIPQGDLFQQCGRSPETRGISRGEGSIKGDKTLDERLDACDHLLLALGS